MHGTLLPSEILLALLHVLINHEAFPWLSLERADESRVVKARTFLAWPTFVFKHLAVRFGTLRAYGIILGFC